MESFTDDRDRLAELRRTYADEADLVPLLTHYYAEHIERQQQVLSRQDRQLVVRLRLTQVAGEVAARLQVGGGSFYHPDLEIIGGTITVGFGVLSGSVVVTDGGSGADGSPARREQRLNAQAAALILMWVVVLTLPTIQELLPGDVREILNSYCGAVALALAVQWRMNDKCRR
jgi:hypothetical protein